MFLNFIVPDNTCINVELEDNRWNISVTPRNCISQQLTTPPAIKRKKCKEYKNFLPIDFSFLKKLNFDEL